MIETKAEKKNTWLEFFSDQNVRFPKKPKLIQGISIYEAPYGLGIQMRGGPNKIVIRGKNSTAVFSSLKPILDDGNKTVDQIFDDLSNTYEQNDIASVLRILHANSLLTSEEGSEENTSILVPITQLDYYNRVIGKTGFNRSSQEVFEIVAKTKVLLLLSENMIAPILTCMNMAGFKHIGLFGEGSLQDHISGNLLNFVNTKELSADSILENFQNKISDYQFIVLGIENPSTDFLLTVNSICLHENKPLIFITKKINTYEIGPYVSPYRSACYSCYTLRKNSYNEDAIHENVYQDDLTAKKRLSDNTIKGDDVLSTLVSAGFMLTEFVKIITGYAYPTLVNQVVEYDSLDGQFVYKRIMRVPGCPACSR